MLIVVVGVKVGELDGVAVGCIVGVCVVDSDTLGLFVGVLERVIVFDGVFEAVILCVGVFVGVGVGSAVLLTLAVIEGVGVIDELFVGVLDILML